MNKARLTISRTLGGHDGYVSITVIDGTSRTTIVECKMGFEDFAKVVLGQAEMEADIKRIVTPEEADRLGKTCVTESRFCEKVKGGDEQSAEVQRAFETDPCNEAFILFDNGIGTQQNGDMHRYVVRKWVETTSEDK